MKWDRFVSSWNDLRPVIWSKKLIHFGGYRLRLHKIVRADKRLCFHSHESRCFRLILWGGYVEEILEDDLEPTRYKTLYPGYFGTFDAGFTHRVDELLGKSSYSLFLMCPKQENVEFYGQGWGLLD
jgi:hypothetical protein